ncbi:MAG TPA: Ig-like domain-containing protein [Solirubrobacterales bacterium]|nr:Ig-like domain-containing protein [Solirubrobacterales bacterium]
METTADSTPRRRTAAAAGLALIAIALLGALPTAPASAHRTTVKGFFGCSDRGAFSRLRGMNVELWKRGPSIFPVEMVGTQVERQYTRPNGSFRFRTEAAEEEYFVRMALRDADGVHLRDFWGVNDWSVDSPDFRNSVARRQLGLRVFAKPGVSHKCAIWAAASAANRDYKVVTGRELPSRGVEIRADAVTAGVPLTPGTSIFWPGDYPAGNAGPGDDATVRHEFGHVIRHGLDGSIAHFLTDVARFNYLQFHNPCLQTNLGFAFNEGWAQYWAKRFTGAPDCGRPGDMTTEGNVAAALTALAANCAGGSRALMVDVLRRNPGTIHSFFEFRDRLGCPVPGVVPVTVIPGEATELPPPPPRPKARGGFARDVVRAASGQIGELRRRLKEAVGRAKEPPPCFRNSCTKALRVRVRPATLAFELRLARIQRAAAAPFDSAREQRRLARLGTAKLRRVQARRLAKTRRQVVGVAIAGVSATLRAARPVLRRDSSRYAKRIRGALAGALARFRRAKRNGAKALPASLALSPPATRWPRRAPRDPRTPPPAPISPPALVPVSPPTEEPRKSTLTIDQCPAEVVTPKPIEVAGSLSPAAAGSPVAVTFDYPKDDPVTKTVTTGADGSWSADHTPNPNYVGTWTVTAHFAGDATRLPATAPTCATEHEPD